MAEPRGIVYRELSELHRKEFLAIVEEPEAFFYFKGGHPINPLLEALEEEEREASDLLRRDPNEFKVQYAEARKGHVRSGEPGYDVFETFEEFVNVGLRPAARRAAFEVVRRRNAGFVPDDGLGPELSADLHITNLLREGHPSNHERKLEADEKARSAAKIAEGLVAGSNPDRWDYAFYARGEEVGYPRRLLEDVANRMPQNQKSGRKPALTSVRRYLKRGKFAMPLDLVKNRGVR